jgi:hypothetical protein
MTTRIPGYSTKQHHTRVGTVVDRHKQCLSTHDDQVAYCHIPTDSNLGRKGFVWYEPSTDDFCTFSGLFS